ncbi:MAG: hypothetical protein WC942_04195 [Clostridia bacterium]|jgi:hypothetical protein
MNIITFSEVFVNKSKRIGIVDYNSILHEIDVPFDCYISEIITINNNYYFNWHTKL